MKLSILLTQKLLDAISNYKRCFLLLLPLLKHDKLNFFCANFSLAISDYNWMLIFNIWSLYSSTIRLLFFFALSFCLLLFLRARIRIAVMCADYCVSVCMMLCDLAATIACVCVCVCLKPIWFQYMRCWPRIAGY